MGGSVMSGADKKWLAVMLYRRKRFIKMMQQGAPPLIFRRLAKANRVIFQLTPMNQ